MSCDISCGFLNSTSQIVDFMKLRNLNSMVLNDDANSSDILLKSFEKWVQKFMNKTNWLMTRKITLSNMWKDTFLWNICVHMISASSLGCSVLSNQGIFKKQISFKVRCQIPFQISLLFSRGVKHNELSVILYKVRFFFKKTLGMNLAFICF